MWQDSNPRLGLEYADIANSRRLLLHILSHSNPLRYTSKRIRYTLIILTKCQKSSTLPSLPIQIERIEENGIPYSRWHKASSRSSYSPSLLLHVEMNWMDTLTPSVVRYSFSFVSSPFAGSKTNLLYLHSSVLIFILVFPINDKKALLVAQDVLSVPLKKGVSFPPRQRCLPRDSIPHSA